MSHWQFEADSPELGRNVVAEKGTLKHSKTQWRHAEAQDTKTSSYVIVRSRSNWRKFVGSNLKIGLGPSGPQQIAHDTDC